MKRLSVLLMAVLAVALLVGFTPSVNSSDPCDINYYCQDVDPACNLWYCCLEPDYRCIEQGYPVYKVMRSYERYSSCQDHCFLWKMCVSSCDPL